MFSQSARADVELRERMARPAWSFQNGLLGLSN